MQPKSKSGLWTILLVIALVVAALIVLAIRQSDYEKGDVAIDPGDPGGYQAMTNARRAAGMTAMGTFR